MVVIGDFFVPEPPQAEEKINDRRAQGGEFSKKDEPKKMFRTVWHYLISIPHPAWVAAIVLGAILFAIGNIFYPLSKQAEETRLAVRTIEETIKPELIANLVVLRALKQQLAPEGAQEIRADALRTGAWSTISNSQFLLKLNPEIRTSLIETYGQIYRANEYHKKLVELMTELTGPTSNVNAIAAQTRQIFLNVLNKTEPQLETLISTRFQA